MMERQNEMLRAHASGSFRDLVVGILKDLAMLVYLDNGENLKDHPNENFGRELLELFTMGVGNYTELDIREASPAGPVDAPGSRRRRCYSGVTSFGRYSFPTRTRSAHPIGRCQASTHVWHAGSNRA